jgi:4-amino-4-deoxy-L-arabinose transferase-like glycosyltransferase
MLPFLKKYKIEISIFFLAVLVRLVFFLVCLSVNGGDVIATIRGQDWYFEISRNLILGNGFSAETVPPFTPYSYGVPGYPYFLYFLLLLIGSYGAVAMIQLLLSAGIPLLGMSLARVIVPPSSEFKHVPLAVAVLLALAPYQVLHSFIFFTETLFTSLLLVFLLLFLKFLKEPSTRLVVLSGLVLGLATLVKPTVQYVPILVIVFTLWRFRNELRKKLFVQLGYFLLVFLIILSPWVYRNYRTFHVVNLSAQVSFNLYVTLLPSVLAIEHHSGFEEERAKLPPLTQNTYFDAGKIATTQILSHPVALVKLSLLSAFTFFTHDGMLTFLGSAGVTPSVYLHKPAILLAFSEPLEFAKTIWGYMHTSMAMILFARLFWIVVTFCFGFGLYQIFRRRIFSPQLLFAVTLVFYFMLTTMINGLTVNARFRMPVEPIIFTVACIGFIPIYQRAKNLHKHA